MVSNHKLPVDIANPKRISSCSKPAVAEQTAFLWKVAHRVLRFPVACRHRPNTNRSAHVPTPAKESEKCAGKPAPRQPGTPNAIRERRYTKVRVRMVDIARRARWFVHDDSKFKKYRPASSQKFDRSVNENCSTNKEPLSQIVNCCVIVSRDPE